MFTGVKYPIFPQENESPSYQRNQHMNDHLLQTSALLANDANDAHQGTRE